MMSSHLEKATYLFSYNILHLEHDDGNLFTEHALGSSTGVNYKTVFDWKGNVTDLSRTINSVLI